MLVSCPGNVHLATPVCALTGLTDTGHCHDLMSSQYTIRLIHHPDSTLRNIYFPISVEAWTEDERLMMEFNMISICILK